MGACARVCVPDVEVGRGGDIAIRLRLGRYWFSAAAQDKGATAALLHTPVNLRPEGDKVINRRYQRNTNHKPDGKICNPVHGEEVVAIDWPLFPAMIKNNGDHRDNLNHHLELAQFAGLDRKVL